jgi:cytochrome b561/polyisoprenoid-binding protein YceI
MTAAERYGAVAVVLHWTIAAGILANLGLGWWMHHAIDVAATQARAIDAFQVHKSLGLTVLALSVLRLAWRLAHRAPPLPAALPGWQRASARLVQWALYALMVVVPLSGWTYVSAQWRGDAPLAVPTLWFGLFQVPHLFDAAALGAGERAAIATRNFTAHAWLAWGMAGLLVAHAAAALKHRLVNRDGVFESMVPRRGGVLALGAVLAGLAVLSTASVVRPGSSDAGQVEGVAGSWIIDPASEIAFAGEDSGTPFRGRFTRWQADIRLAPKISVTATVETASARDGDAMHEQTLTEDEWFDVDDHPTARYVAERVVPQPDGALIEGTLTIKGRPLKVPPLRLTAGENEVRIEGRFEVDRAEANLGMESDPLGEYVSKRILVEVRVIARPPAP